VQTAESCVAHIILQSSSPHKPFGLALCACVRCLQLYTLCGEELGQEIFITCQASRSAMGPTEPSVPLVLGALAQGVYWPRWKADYCPPSSTEVKNEWMCTSTSCFHSVHRDDDFTLLLVVRKAPVICTACCGVNIGCGGILLSSHKCSRIII
jgi:hypothetical protein